MVNDSRTSNSIVIFVLMGLVLVIMIGLALVLYIVKDSMQDKLNLGKNQNVSVGSIERSQYSDKEGGFLFYYPSDWTFMKNTKYDFSLKKMYSRKSGSVESNVVTMIINVGKIQNVSGLDVKQVIMRETGKEPMKAVLIGEREILRVDKCLTGSGLPKDSVYWKKDNNVYFLEGIYYNKDSADLEKEFEKIIASLEFF